MGRGNSVEVKSKAFALRVVEVYKSLANERHEYVLSRQLLRSGTSIGANVSEAEYGVSRNDFLAKMYIALKECAETKYWLELLYESKYLSEDDYKQLINDCTELLKILSSITKSTKENINGSKHS